MRREIMATAKTKSTKKVNAKAKVAKKVSLDESRKIKAYANQDHHFYVNKATGKFYPRGQAYEILAKAKGRQMVVGTFLKKIQSATGVTEPQARGIVQKLVGKPDDSGNPKNVCRFV
jgi:hypothetical protein